MRGWTIAQWTQAYESGKKPFDLISALVDGIDLSSHDWISIISSTQLQARVDQLDAQLTAAGGDISQLPLYGVPFAVKDNIDVVGFDTTAGCKEFTYTPKESATVVHLLEMAGAIVIGKANLDQFATGLVGVRTPYGIPGNSFNKEYVSGGSSSGSGVTVAKGIVPFSLGTDTAGSGRVPAGLNNIVGLKPTKGAFSQTGLIRACRTLDCISVFALTVEDAVKVYDIAQAFDAADGYSREMPVDDMPPALPSQPTFGIPSKPEFYGDALAEKAFNEAITFAEKMGAKCVPVDFAVLDQVAALLYDGSWVAERYAAIRAFAEQHEASIHPVVHDIVYKAEKFSAADAFDGFYKLADLKRIADALLAKVDALLVPTAPSQYRIDDVLADPIKLNSNLGKYTNFVNLLDWSALAVPFTIRPDGLPFGVTLIGQAWQERALAEFALKWHQASGMKLGATDASVTTNVSLPALPKNPSVIRVAVVGAHLRGMPLNKELTERDATFVEATTTSSDYKLYALANTTPAKPGLVKSTEGAAIKVELWDMPTQHFASFVAGIAAPLGIGTLVLADGRLVKGFICEPIGLTGAKDITEFGGWAAYVSTTR